MRVDDRPWSGWAAARSRRCPSPRVLRAQREWWRRREGPHQEIATGTRSLPWLCSIPEGRLTRKPFRARGHQLNGRFFCSALIPGHHTLKTTYAGRLCKQRSTRRGANAKAARQTTTAGVVLLDSQSGPQR